MCVAVEFNKNEISASEKLKHNFRVDGDFVRVSVLDSRPMLLIKAHGGNRLVFWGNSEYFHCKKESLTTGKWSHMKPELVEIVANRAQTHGTWFQVKEGIRGILINTRGVEQCFILTEPSTHYFKTMTHAERMAVLIGQVI